MPTRQENLARTDLMPALKTRLILFCHPPFGVCEQNFVGLSRTGTLVAMASRKRSSREVQASFADTDLIWLRTVAMDVSRTFEISEV